MLKSRTRLNPCYCYTIQHVNRQHNNQRWDSPDVAYLADLAVDAKCQKQGIGKQLIKETRKRLKPECMIVLLAAPKANEYYPKLGFEHNPRAWVLRGG